MKKARQTIAGQAGRNEDGTISAFAGRAVYKDGSWLFEPFSADPHALDGLFADLMPGDGPVDIELTIKRKDR